MFVSIEGLEWNTIEDMVIKWNQVFRDFCLDEESGEYSYITQSKTDLS
ncbi:MAG: hypothetical protein ACI9H6_000637 [Patiriisocius sp.]|jgi:hypothetical protein